MFYTRQIYYYIAREYCKRCTGVVDVGAAVVVVMRVSHSSVCPPPSYTFVRHFLSDAIAQAAYSDCWYVSCFAFS